MATPSKPIILKITDAGKLGALNPTGDAVKLSVNLTHVAIGSGRYTPTGKETKIKTLIAKIVTASGDIDAATNTLQFSATIYADKVTPVYELGLLTETGALFAIAASLNEPLFTLYPNVTFVVAFGMSLNEASSDKVTVMLNPNVSLMPAIMQNHLAAPNPHPQYLGIEHLDVSKDPHPQYLDFKRFQLLLEALIPIGYLHHTHSTTNPKSQFDELLGINTAWRRLLGKTIVATDPADPFIKDVGMTLGQKGMTTDAGSNRPHTYPLYTTNIFERYNPDDVIETVWQVSASKTSIDEGAAIRFTVTASNLPDGQILKWTVKEGALNSASNDITAPDATKSGSVILKNGRAIVDYTTTPDDNIAEAQKHVRLTVGAPANLSINVPINDAGRNETIVHIQNDSFNGLMLDEYYKKHSGAYAVSTDTIRFIVDDNVNVIAPNTETPAIEDGLNWPAGAQIILENHGRILGRGGDGGRSAYYYTMWNSKDEPQYDANFNYSRPAEAGGNGGTAIKGNMLVENYGLIAGGGGGGGGLGIYAKAGTKYYLGGGGTGGGAPFGKRSPNEATYSMYLLDDKFPSPRAPKYVVGGRGYGVIFHRVAGAWTTHKDTSYGVRVAGGAPNWLETRGVFNEMDVSNPTIHAAEGFKTYRIESHRRTTPVSTPLIMSQSATLDTAGNGGANLTPSMFQDEAGLIAILSGDREGVPSVTGNTRGGNGGGLGESGESGVPKVLFGVFASPNRMSPIDAASVVWRQPSALGGQAGYVKEGSVVIKNLDGGVTKGR